MRRFFSLCTVVLAFVTGSAVAAPVMYSANNNGVLQALTPLGLIGIAEGNFVMVQPGALTAGDIGATFLMRFQAKSDGAIFDNGNVGFTFPGEVTVEFVVPLEFVSISGTRREFALDNTVAPGPGNYYHMFHDSVPIFGDSSVAAGTGFTDGTPIFSGSFFDVFYSIDTADLPGTFLASMTVDSYAATAFSIPVEYVAQLDGAVFIPGQLTNSALIAGYAPVAGDIKGSVDLTMTFAIPEASTTVLFALGLVAAFDLVRRRRSA